MSGHRLVATATLFAAGCSWIHVERPRRPPPGMPVTCDPDPGWPMVDATISILSYTGLLSGLTWLIYADPENERTGQIAGGSLLALGLSGWIWAASYASGEKRAYACNYLHREPR